MPRCTHRRHWSLACSIVLFVALRTRKEFATHRKYLMTVHRSLEIFASLLASQDVRSGALSGFAEACDSVALTSRRCDAAAKPPHRTTKEDKRRSAEGKKSNHAARP